MEGERKSVLQSVVNVGCILGLVLALACVWIFVLRSRPGEPERPELAAVQTALRERFAAPELTVAARDEDGSILAVNVLDAPFLDELELHSPAAQQEALHVATHARHALPADARYDHYEIRLERRVEHGLGVTLWKDYRFAAADLPPR